ncbi:putative Lipoprotein [Gammaproteobacteria bacterium]
MNSAPVPSPEKSIQKTDPSLIHDRYLDHGDGTVTDVVNKLRWKRCCEGQIWDGKTCVGEATKYRWKDLPKPSEDGWRVPTVEEAKTLLYCRNTGKWGDSLPVTKDSDWNKLSHLEKYVCGKDIRGTNDSLSIDKEVFVNNPFWIWTSSEYAHNAGYAWVVDFYDGHVNGNGKYHDDAVRVVSSSQ